MRHRFLDRKIGTDSVVFMADNNFIAGIGGSIITKDNEEDTYKLRELSDGTTYEIIKNYYSTEELKGYLEPGTRDLDISVGECFWWVQYSVA